MRLTDLAIRKIQPPDKGQKTHFDEALPGFGVRISQGGSKSYVVMYGPRRRLKTIGRFPDMKLTDARRAAKKVQSDSSLLFAEPVPSAEVITFDEVRRRFLDASARKNRPRTIAGISTGTSSSLSRSIRSAVTT